MRLARHMEGVWACVQAIKSEYAILPEWTKGESGSSASLPESSWHGTSTRPKTCSIRGRARERMGWSQQRFSGPSGSCRRWTQSAPRERDGHSVRAIVPSVWPMYNQRPHGKSWSISYPERLERPLTTGQNGAAILECVRADDSTKDSSWSSLRGENSTRGDCSLRWLDAIWRGSLDDTAASSDGGAG